MTLRTTLGPLHPSTLKGVGNLGCLLEKQGKLGEAEAQLREALAGLCCIFGRAHEYTQGAYAVLLRVLTAQGKAREARELRAQYGGGK